MFELTDEEVEELSRCKNFTLKDEENGRGKNIKYNSHAKDGVKIRVYSDNLMKGLSAIEYTDFRKQYTGLDIELYESGGVFHDRYIAQVKQKHGIIERKTIISPNLRIVNNRDVRKKKLRL